MAKQYWQARIGQNIEVAQLLSGDEAILENIEKSADVIVKAYQGGGKLLLCGNGGSAADSQHIAAELVSRFYRERKALDAEALTVNSSSITAIGNDYSYDSVFSRQVEAKGRKGDVLIGISTSGNSPNVIKAIEKGNEIGMITVGLTGSRKEAAINKSASIVIGVPSSVTPRIQEMHILIGHMICEYIEEKLFP
ncbi:MAG: D-sedoheptulose 7-phosphate isomerase [Nitrospinota bacterium]|nr:D-sedoheptulose 7-phosphate isomerase [Nitrospinota bacterium]